MLGDENKDTSNLPSGVPRAGKLDEEFPFKIDRKARPISQRDPTKPAVQPPETQIDKQRASLQLSSKEPFLQEQELK